MKLASTELIGIDEGGLTETLNLLESERFAQRLWHRDPRLWKGGADATVVTSRLGWLNAPAVMLGQVTELQEFGTWVRANGYEHAVVMGMGGSSLCPIVLRKTFGVRPGHPNVAILDSTVPETVLAVERGVDLRKTLFIEASKSGTTLEIWCFAEYFFDKVSAAIGDGAGAGKRFVCITDAGTSLQKIALQRGYAREFLNPPDIGGRYSALSFFGLVPAAVAGFDVAALLERAQAMAWHCRGGVKAQDNPGLVLGAALATAKERQAKDKITFRASQAIGAVGMWLEQLLAESTGKDGTGLIPIADEPLGDPAAESADRVFVYLIVGDDRSFEERIDVAKRNGQAALVIHLKDALDLGAEFFRWEFATAVAGALLGIDPFDEPNVKESKDNTNRVLTQTHGGSLPPPPKPAAGPEDQAALVQHLRSLRAGDYFALQAFIGESEIRTDLLQQMRACVRDGARVATTLGFGPRFLHSTGQLHKGGPNTGVFLQLTGGDREPVPIPGQSYDFGTLKSAQALGDLQSLIAHERRVLAVDLGPDVDVGLARLQRTISNAFAPAAT